MREVFHRELSALRDEILLMASRVHEELDLALDAFQHLDLEKAQQVQQMDRVVNQERFRIEEQCSLLIVTQQPAARDLRAIVAAMNMVIDLERMGDQAKGVAKVVPNLIKEPSVPRPSELLEMGQAVGAMLNKVMDAYASGDIERAREVAQQDDAIDMLYECIFTQLMTFMAHSGSPERAMAAYEVLRVARELERFGDLTTNVAARCIYLFTGVLEESHLSN